MFVEKDGYVPTLPMEELQERKSACNRAIQFVETRLLANKNPTSSEAISLGVAHFFYGILYDSFDLEIQGRHEEEMGVIIDLNDTYIEPILEGFSAGSFKFLKSWLIELSDYNFSNAAGAKDYGHEEEHEMYLSLAQGLENIVKVMPDSIEKPPSLPSFPWDDERFQI